MFNLSGTIKPLQRVAPIWCLALVALALSPDVIAQVTPGIDLEFNAAFNPVDGTDFWHPNVDTLPFNPSATDPNNLTIPREYVWFGQSQSFSSVSDSAFSGITGSYTKGGTGRNRDDVPNDGTQPFIDGPNGWVTNANDPNGKSPDGSAGTFEIWFKNNSLTGGEQVIAEWGGGGRGSYISLIDDQVSFFSNGDGQTNFSTASGTISTSDWHQVVGIFHNVSDDNTDDDYVSLYIDGMFVADSSAAPVRLDRWTGNNAWGFGEIGISNDPLGPERADDGPLALGASDDPNGLLALDGEISILRYYFDQELTEAEVLANYVAVASADVDRNGVVDGLDFLKIQRINPGLISTWAAQYGTSPVRSHVAPVPEPTAFVLLATGLSLFFLGSRGGR